MTILKTRAYFPKTSAQNFKDYYSAYGEEDFSDGDEEEDEDEPITTGPEEEEEFDEAEEE